LMYAVLAGRGFSVLIGDAGTGKTTLLRALMRGIPDSRAVFSVVVNPTLNPTEFLRTCVADFGIDVGESAKDVVLTKLQRFLLETRKDNKVAVLIVDEAHCLSTELLEEVRLLTNFETEKEKLIQVILAGQDELADILDRHDLRQLKQRVTTRLHIKPLSTEAVAAYIRHRWSRCSNGPVPFDAAAMVAIRDISGGIPRLVNSICENALLLGFSLERRIIDVSVIAEVAKDLHLAPAGNLNGAREAQPARARNQRTEAAAPLPIDSAHRPAVPTLEHYMPRRGWRVRFGLK
jgi:general secretion pathway protein A